MANINSHREEYLIDHSKMMMINDSKWNKSLFAAPQCTNGDILLNKIHNKKIYTRKKENKEKNVMVIMMIMGPV